MYVRYIAKFWRYRAAAAPFRRRCSIRGDAHIASSLGASGTTLNPCDASCLPRARLVRLPKPECRMRRGGASASLVDRLRAAQRKPLNTRAAGAIRLISVFHHAVLHADIAGRTCARRHVPRSIVMTEEENRQQPAGTHRLDTQAEPTNLRTVTTHAGIAGVRASRLSTTQCSVFSVGLMVVSFASSSASNFSCRVHAAHAGLATGRPIFIRMPMKVLTRHSSALTAERGCVRHA